MRCPPDIPISRGPSDGGRRCGASQAVRSLGARLFPRLATGDLWVAPAEVPELDAECALLGANLPLIVSGTAPAKHAEEQIGRRLRNVVDAARRARLIDGGVVIW